MERPKHDFAIPGREALKVAAIVQLHSNMHHHCLLLLDLEVSVHCITSSDSESALTIATLVHDSH
jgi:hypothetical protein